MQDENPLYNNYTTDLTGNHIPVPYIFKTSQNFKKFLRGLFNY